MTDVKKPDTPDIKQKDTVLSGDGGAKADKASKPKEIGGRSGPEPTRYGDWEKNGIISDF